MRRLLVALLAFAPPLAAQDGRDTVLRVLRRTPHDRVTPGAYVTVTFDRPVAGALDRSVDAAKIFRIEPMVAGTVAWRDPITIRFLPLEPLAPGREFTVTVDTGFRAIDGSRLAARYKFTFRVPGPALLAHAPRRDRGQVLAPGQKIHLLYSAPIDLAALGRVTRLEFGCTGQPRIKLTPVTQRPVRESDGYEFQYAGGWDRDTVADRFRRVVELVPEAEVPGDCEGWLVVPETVTTRTAAGEDRFHVRTQPSFRFERVECWEEPACTSGSLYVKFTTAVKRADLQRHVRIEPSTPFTVSTGLTDGAEAWLLRATLAPRTKYRVIADAALRDVQGRLLVGASTRTIDTPDRPARVEYGAGFLTVAGRGRRALPVRHVNVDTVDITVFRVRDGLRARAIGLEPWWADASHGQVLLDSAVVRHPLRGTFNNDTTTLIPLDDLRAAVRATGLIAVRVDVVATTPPPGTPRAAPSRHGVRVTALRRSESSPPLAIVQATDLAAHAKLHGAEGSVFVTGVSDGRPRRGARVVLFDESDVAVAQGTTNDEGVAVLASLPANKKTRGRSTALTPQDPERLWPAAGYVEVSYQGDRSVTPLAAERRIGYYPRPSPLDPSRLGAREADDAQIAGVVLTERGIYRPGETVFAKAIVRTGMLGALRRPARPDSVRWVIKHAAYDGDDDDAETIRDTVVALSDFGTSVDSLRLRPTLPLGRYTIEVRLESGFGARTAARGEFRLAEYRAPEFLVDVTTDSLPRYARDTVTARIAARYLFGAPMGNGRLRWATMVTDLPAWELSVPNTEGWTLGESPWDWWRAAAVARGVDRSGEATLDSSGRVSLPLVVPDSTFTRPARLEVSAAVTDVNRQAVTASASVVIHPASVYIAARHAGAGWLWTTGTPHTVEMRAVRPNGRAVIGLPVKVTVARRRWVYGHVDGDDSPGAGWRTVVDTVTRDSLITAQDAVAYTFTPRDPGEYSVRLTALDERGRSAATTVSAYAIGGGRPWWAGDSPYRLPLVAHRDRLAAGDTAAVVFDSPFERAEAWLTVEREGLLEQQRLSVRRGTTTVRVPVTERHAPNVFVSVLLVRTSDRGVTPPDSAPDVLRAGYTELHVDPAIKRLLVSVVPTPPERGPGDTAVVHVNVRDQRKRGVRSEVALWAVDEGVLALTDYKTSDPVSALYEPRGVGSRLRSTLTSVFADPALLREALREAAARRRLARLDMVTVSSLAMEVPVAAPVYPAEAEIPADAIRSRFRSTAFFIGAVVTDDTGSAVVRAKLPDNLTTYRVIAVAVSDGDQYGTGETSLLVTRSLVARPALPRFVRAGDSLLAGPVVNARDGAARKVRVDAQVEGLSLRGSPRQTVPLEPGRGAEARFSFQVPPRDSVRDTVLFRFGVAAEKNRDAVETRLGVRPDFHPRAHTAVGVVRDAVSVEFRLPADIDPARSRLTLRVGSSPLVPMLAAYERLRVYPYYCTEQISSGGRALVAVYRAMRLGKRSPGAIGPDPLGRLQQLADELSLRQREDGAIGLWRRTDWSSPWLSAYAGLFLLDAKAAGVAVEERVIDKLAEYLASSLEDSTSHVRVSLSGRSTWRLGLGDRVSAVDFLRRAGRAASGAEERLLARAQEMWWEDRLRLAEVLAPRKDVRPRIRAVVDEAWRGATLAGGRVELPDTLLTPRDFPSHVRPAARLLTATLALRPDHPMAGALVQTVLQQGRAEGRWAWNTQDYAAVVTALAQLEAGEAATAVRRVTVIGAGRTLLDRAVRPSTTDLHEAGTSEAGDSAVVLTGLLRRDRQGAVTLPLRVAVSEGRGRIYYALTVEEVPARPPVTPDIKGITVERWYERFDTGKPVTSIEEGELVRVRLRVTVPSDRHFVVVDDALPAGLEPVDLSLRMSGTLGPFATPESDAAARYGDRDRDGPRWQAWLYGSWDNGWWSPWDHKEIRDDRVVYFARALWRGTYTASYVARATTRGTFIRPPAHAEEMYNPALHGRSDGGVFQVKAREDR
ncbi:MAG: alpha-2-macroglobulin family protein [Gemmatimonadaceae bacterium]